MDDYGIKETEMPVAWKYNDPAEDARWVYDEGDLEDIERQDSGLIRRVKAHKCTKCGKVIIEYHIDTAMRGYEDAQFDQMTSEVYCEDCFEEVE